MHTSLVVLLLNLIVHAQPAITATDGWLPEPAAGQTSAAAYLTVNNPTMYDIYVTDAASEVAGKIELRDGEKTAKELTVPSFGFLELKAGGPHLMLMDLKKALKAGESVELVLTTDGGIVLKLSATVKKP